MYAIFWIFSTRVIPLDEILDLFDKCHSTGWREPARAKTWAIFSTCVISLDSTWKTKPPATLPPDFKSGGNEAGGFVIPT